MPNKFWMVKGESGNGSGYYYTTTLTKQKKLNLDHKPCEDDPKYKFNSCIKESLLKKVGCRFPMDNHVSLFDKQGSQWMEVCSTASQYRQYNEIYQNLMTADMQEIVDITGCKKPCTYNENKFTSSTPDEDPRSTIPNDQIYKIYK